MTDKMPHTKSDPILILILSLSLPSIHSPMPSLQDLLTQEPSSSPPPQPPPDDDRPPIGDAAIRAVIAILSAHLGRILKDQAQRIRLKEKCTALCCLNASAHAAIANLQLGIDSIERLIVDDQVGGTHQGGGELKIRSLRNAIWLLTVAADVNSRRRRRGGGGGFTGGVANAHVAACSHLYLAVVYKIEKKDRASARHLLQVFCDAPYLARRNLLPDLWDHFFLPHLLHLKVWYAKEVDFISGWDSEFREQRMKSLDRAYNDQMDVGTSQFALYYKEWVKLGSEAPPLPSVSLPSIAVCRNMHNTLVSLALEREDIAVNLVRKTEVEAKGGSCEVGISFHSDTGLQSRSNSNEQHQFQESTAPIARRSYSLRLFSCRSNSNKDPVHPTQIPKSKSFNNFSISNLDHAVSLISNSNSLLECEMAIRAIAKACLDSQVESIMKTTFSTSSFIEGLLEVSFTSKDDNVLELAISILAELVTRSEVTRQAVLNADPQLEIFLRLSEKSDLFMKVVVLVYLLKPKAKQMLSSDWIPLVLCVLDIGDETQTLFTVQCCPKAAAIYLLDQLIMGFDVDRNLENARQMVELGGLGLLIRRLELGNTREKESCASLLATCVRADVGCRDYLVDNIKKSTLVQLFMGNQLKSNGGSISLLSEMICLNRTSRMIEFLNGLKNVGCLNTMHVLLVYLQQAPHEQRPVAASLILQLDLLGDSSKCSFYREEGMKAIVAALERSLHDRKLQEPCSRALLLLGGRFSLTGEPKMEAWLLKRAGFDDAHEDLFRTEERIRDEFERTEEEEKTTETWLRKLAVVLLMSGNKRFLVGLSNCIADGIPGLARSCLITVAWMSRSISLLRNSKNSPQSLACSILAPRLFESLNYDKAMEERVLASVSLLNFARNQECRSMLFPLGNETLVSLEDLSRVTWTAEELLFTCSQRLHTSCQAPNPVFINHPR